MRQVLVVLVTVLAVLALAPTAAPAREPEPFPCESFTTGRSYGYEHVRAAAQAGILGHEHKPGMHAGYSQCR